MLADAEKGTGAVWATRNDPRITPLGSSSGKAGWMNCRNYSTW